VPAKAFYPTEADVEVALRALGLFDTDELPEILQFLDLATFADAAVAQWEEETGWHPFLANTTDINDEDQDETRYFDPGGPNFRPQILGGGYQLDLGTALWKYTALRSGVTSDSVGTALTRNEDFYLLPYNADQAAIMRGWTQVEFLVGHWGARRSITIQGRFGRVGTVPDDAWLAILHHGVMTALPEIATRVGGGRLEFTEAGVTERFGPGFLLGGRSSGEGSGGALGDAWMREWDRAVRRYQRIVV
jgi:hypothetical protein